ncbi:hypothetical protein [Aliiroseovarius crassostreae]|uniref:hypothetical protein n=1 Tax=Aliiroseovarius crassostreae TaxID=154981 RepID=UPI00223B135D|nr:hypothetical protein [Aliiroseovarius crassostreae]
MESLVLHLLTWSGGTNWNFMSFCAASLDQHLTEENIKIKSEKRGAIVARWYQSHIEGREVTDGDVHTWIELVRE